MANKRKVTGTATSIPIGIGLGTSVCVGITLLGAALTAYLIHKEVLTEENIGFASMVILVIASSLGSWIAINKIQKMRMQMSLLTGACYYLCLIGMTALFFGGQYSGMGMTAMCVLSGSGCVSLLNIQHKKQMKMNWRKKAYR